MQKNQRELELMVQECILAAIRDSIPTEEIIRAYMDESTEQEEEVFIENIPAEEEEGKKSEDVKTGDEEMAPPVVPAIQNVDNEEVVTRLTFNNSVDYEEDKPIEEKMPKSLEEMERNSSSRVIQRRLEEEESDDERIKISGDMIDLSGFDVLDEEPKVDQTSHGFVLDDIEELF